MFTALGQGIAHRPALFVLPWIGALILGAAGQRLWLSGASAGGTGAILPPHSPYSQAQELLRLAFPPVAAESQVVVLAARETGITPGDLEWLDRLGQAAGEVSGAHVLSPTSPFLRARLLSRDNQAAMLVVNLSTSFISPQTTAAVERITALARSQPPQGLTVEIDGTAAIGRDYTQATQAGAARTTWVTVLAVLVILALVYRSPVGALVPLVSIGACAYIAYLVLKLLTRLGWEFSSTEWIFCIVLIFGAGIDYALFWIARYREVLSATPGFSNATVEATVRTGPAIVTGAATMICGLTTMLAADLVPSRNAGKVLAVALAVNLLAALTLTPALARLFGRRLFWPAGAATEPGLGARHWWPWLARHVTAHPLPVLLIGSVVLAIPAAYSLRIEPAFRAVFDVPRDAPSERGVQLAEQHFSRGQLYSATLLIEFAPAALPDADDFGRKLTDQLRAEPGVSDVYSLAAPLGESGGPARSLLLLPLVRSYYEAKSAAGAAVLRFELLLDDRPFEPRALAAVQHGADAARQAFAVAAPQADSPRVLLAGPSAYILAVRTMADADQRRVMLLATAVIAAVVLALVRDLPLTIYMVLATWLTYGATLTLSTEFFIHGMGLPGPDWKVRLILFVIVVAVGQDYNIFLVARLRDETRRLTRLPAVQHAIVRTGPVISSCGIIMAATLGSLWAGGLSLLRQLGFALALGILIDTFFVRPLLIPAFFLLFGRTTPANASQAADAPGL